MPSRAPDVVRHALDAFVRLYERQRLLRSDPFDPVVEIGADEDGEIHERLAIDAPAFEEALEHDRLRDDRPEGPPAGQEFLARDGQEADQPGRAEEQRIVVLARGRPYLIRGCGHVRGLRLALGRRLHRGDAHQPQQFARFRHHFPRQA